LFIVHFDLPYLGLPMPQVESALKKWAVVSLLFVDEYIWAGTNSAAVLIINPTVITEKK
jgi:hypothetical protein